MGVAGITYQLAYTYNCMYEYIFIRCTISFPIRKKHRLPCTPCLAETSVDSLEYHSSPVEYPSPTLSSVSLSYRSTLNIPPTNRPPIHSDPCKYINVRLYCTMAAIDMCIISLKDIPYLSLPPLSYYPLRLRFMAGLRPACVFLLRMYFEKAVVVAVHPWNWHVYLVSLHAHVC